MKYLFLTLIALILSSCMTTQKQDFSPPSVWITEKSVWNGNVDQCFDQGEHCLINEIKKHGSAEALQAAQYFSKDGEAGYVFSFVKEGFVGIAEIAYPFRGNATAEYYLVPKTGPLINLDD